MKGYSKSRWGYYLSLLVAFFVVTLVLSSAAMAAKPLILRWADMSPATGLRPQYLQKAAKEISAATEGRVQIQFYWTNSLVSVKENVRAVQTGIADMAWVSPAYHAAEYPLANVVSNMVSSPKGNDPVFITKAYLNFFDTDKVFRNEIEKWKSTMWFLFPYSSYGCFAKKPMKELKDFKGMRIRVSSEGVGKMISAVGGSPEFLPASEVYAALEKGMMDGAMSDYEWGKRYSLFEVAKYLNLTNMSLGAAYGIVSQRALNKMSEKDRKVFMEIGRKVSIEYAAAYAKERQENMQAMKTKGMTLIEFPSTELDKWAQLPEVKGMLSKWLATEEKAGRGEEARGMMKLFYEKFDMGHLMLK